MGHMPGALNVPSSAIVQDGRLKPPEELAQIFEAAGVDAGKPVVTTCGSGVSAAILTLALAVMGHKEPPVYDGSWTEWGADPELPVATGR
jgi:thiosulfate/3-mercaptopyruvate sulfurtransferase